ncbi:hypothetical protein QTP86_011025 [Hemibagrus guttatus]|nr:hypothetical protein QTP86_011025 [Hemibagrus guttatus]
MEEIAQANEPPPLSCPPTKLNMPTSLHQRVLRWVHEAPSSGHPGIHHTTALIRNRFWWPSLSPVMEEYVGSYATCAQSQMS